jgi:hypothetical protein
MEILNEINIKLEFERFRYWNQLKLNLFIIYFSCIVYKLQMNFRYYEKYFEASNKRMIKLQHLKLTSFFVSKKKNSLQLIIYFVSELNKRLQLFLMFPFPSIGLEFWEVE